LRTVKSQTSETLRIGIFLTLSGGFQDAYSYLCRGKVFANAQTGNMLLLGIKLTKGESKYPEETFSKIADRVIEKVKEL